MKTIILWALLVSLTSILVSHAETTTSANLLNNNTFDENTDGWTLSDSNVKRDSNSYPDAGNSPTIRFKGQTSTITQSVDTSGLETNKEITGVTVKYHGYGCGNSPGGWCNDEADDTIVTNVTLKNETGTEVSSNTTVVPYEDGWTYHTFTKSINDTFLTGETGITFSLQGIDTGDSSNWLGPITDNYELLVTYQDYVAPVVEPVVIEPVVIEPVVIEPVVIESIVVIEPSVIGAIDLSTEVTLDLIQDVQMMPEIPTIELTPEVNNMDMGVDMNMTNIEMPADVNLQSQPIEIEIPQQIDMTVEIRVAPVIPTDIPDLANLAPIDEVQEIQEMPVIEIPVSTDLEVEIEMDSVEMEQPEELNNSTMEEDLVEMNDEIIENVDEVVEEVVEEVSENKENNNEAKETETNDGGDEKSQLSESSETKENKKSEVVKKSKSKDSKKSKKDDVKKTTVKKDKPKSKTKTVAKKDTNKTKSENINVQSLGQVMLPNVYLQVLQDTIKITETLSLQQEMIYEQNTYDLIQLTFESSFGGDSADRFDSLLGVQPSYQSPTYRRSGE